MTVPIDYSDAASGGIRLSVRRLRALDPTHRIGTLVAVAGGPGQRGTIGIRPEAFPASLRERFDIVGWDPRGTSGDSLIDCIPSWDPYGNLDQTPDDMAERMALAQRITDLARGCRDRHAWLLPHLGTLDTVRDLESLRGWLGEPHISILGFSYGSDVAVTYATLFPDHVRAIVLDGYDDPGQTPGQRAVTQAAAFERALDRLLAGCAVDPTCPLGDGSDPGAALDTLLERLDAAPLPASTTAPSGHATTQSDAYEAITGSLLLDAAAQGRLLSALADAVEGRGGPLRAIADEVRHAYESTGLTQGTFMAISCADDAGYWQGLTRKQAVMLEARVIEVAPRLGAWLTSGLLEPGLPPGGLCAMEPASSPQPALDIDAAGAGPVLVLATTGDPTTPLESARRGADGLDQATLVIEQAAHHLAFPYAVAYPNRAADRCVLDIVETYLFDIELPPEGQTCPPSMTSSADPTSATASDAGSDSPCFVVTCIVGEPSNPAIDRVSVHAPR